MQAHTKGSKQSHYKIELSNKRRVPNRNPPEHSL
jgi:hypothetical protein